ncbi:hypothetical protein ACFSJ3_18260 [Corallincola platygyrae]|uniref:Uncharacterized protein n=1 Tax=Corallincola platygyrae TaxID=1193278 RepID=A0ABW4XQT8_9GAMM
MFQRINQFLPSIRWKFFTLICIPVAVVFQVLGGLTFRILAQSDFELISASHLLYAKLTMEVFLYGCMGLYSVKLPKSHRPAIDYLLHLVLFGLAAYTLVVIAQRLLQTP